MRVHEFMHEMHTTSAILARDSGINVVFEGDQAKTDGRTIYLPSMPLNVELTIDQIKAMRGFVDHEAGHIKHSDMKRIISFYDKNQNNGREDLTRLHNSLEDVWMQRKVQNEYPGAWKNLMASQELVRKRECNMAESMSQEELDEILNEWTPSNAAGVIVGSNPDFKEGTYNQELLSKVSNEKLLKWGDRWAELALECENSEDVIKLSKAVYEMFDIPPEDENSLENQDPDEWEPGDGDGEFDEGENSADFNPNGQPQEGQGDEGDGENPLGSEDIESMVNAKSEEGEDAAGGIGDLGDMEGSKYYKVYSTKHDKTYYPGRKTPGGSDRNNTVMKDVDPSAYEKSKSRMQSHIMVMKTKLKRALLARLQRDWDFGREVGRLDTKRLVAASRGVPTVFKQRIDREDEDTAVSVLVDLSGSMSGTKAKVARDCVVALCECFDGTQFKVRVSGFSNNGSGTGGGGWGYYAKGEGYHRYERLDHTVFKDYDMALRKTKPQIGNLNLCIGGNNSDYDFVLKELNILSKRPEQRRVLFVLSDGHPACTSDYNYDEHTRFIKEAIRDASRKGTECVGIGILDGSVERIYPEVAVVHNVEDLSAAAFNKLTKILLDKRRGQ